MIDITMRMMIAVMTVMVDEMIMVRNMRLVVTMVTMMMMATVAATAATAVIICSMGDGDGGSNSGDMCMWAHAHRQTYVSMTYPWLKLTYKQLVYMAM